jgi:CRISPR-associated protein Cmr6
MDIPLYSDEHRSLGGKKPPHAHAGLWFERFFNGYDKDNDWQIPKPKDTKDVKKDWINSVAGNQPQEKKIIDAQLEAFNSRQKTLLDNLKGQHKSYKTDWHFVTGMGNPHPVENGFSWHHTLAVPYLAGSAVKGLVRAWVEMNDDDLDDTEKHQRLKLWFGTADKEEIAEQSGAFIFFDAIPKQMPRLICDIMTPHMGKWYEKGGEGVLTSDAIPADWHEPVPVHFLAVKNAEFVFSIAPRIELAGIEELDKVFSALSNALEWLGAGAKTAAGYGYMTENENYADEIKTQNGSDDVNAMPAPQRAIYLLQQKYDDAKSKNICQPQPSIKPLIGREKTNKPCTA